MTHQKGPGGNPATEELESSREEWLQIQLDIMAPVAPLREIRDPLQAMGAALYHIGMAALQYGLITQDPRGGDRLGGTRPELRYLWAEAEARTAHMLLLRVDQEYSRLHPRLGPEIRKACRNANFLLTRERAMAAVALGIDPPPRASDHDQSIEMDHDHQELWPE